MRDYSKTDMFNMENEALIKNYTIKGKELVVDYGDNKVTIPYSFANERALLEIMKKQVLKYHTQDYCSLGSPGSIFLARSRITIFFICLFIFAMLVAASFSLPAIMSVGIILGIPTLINIKKLIEHVKNMSDNTKNAYFLEHEAIINEVKNEIDPNLLISKECKEMIKSKEEFNLHTIEHLPKLDLEMMVETYQKDVEPKRVRKL